MSILKLSSSLLLITSLLLATPAHAQEELDEVTELVEEYTVYRLPKGFRWSEDGAEDTDGNAVINTYQCYDLGDYKSLLMMDNDLRAAEDTVENLTVAVTNLQAGATSLKRALIAEEATNQLLQRDRMYWFHEWERENKAKHKAENKPTFSWIPWTIAAATTTLTLGMVLALTVGN